MGEAFRLSCLCENSGKLVNFLVALLPLMSYDPCSFFTYWLMRDWVTVGKNLQPMTFQLHLIPTGIKRLKMKFLLLGYTLGNTFITHQTSRCTVPVCVWNISGIWFQWWWGIFFSRPLELALTFSKVGVLLNRGCAHPRGPKERCPWLFAKDGIERVCKDYLVCYMNESKHINA